MKYIKLECKTGGFSYGEVVEVGDEEKNIPLQTAKDLVGAGLAKEYINEVSLASDKKYLEQIKVLEEAVDYLEAEKADLEKQGMELTVANKKLVAEKAELIKQVEELTLKKPKA